MLNKNLNDMFELNQQETFIKLQIIKYKFKENFD